MNFNYRSLLLSTAICVGLAGCEKNLLENAIPQTYPDNTSTAYVKFIYAYAGKTPTLVSGRGPELFLYQDNAKLNGAQTNALAWAAYGGQFPAPSSATTNARSWYTALKSGSSTLYGVQARIASGVPAPNAGDTLFKSTVNLDAGKNYTAFLSDTLQNPSITLVPDDYGTIPDGKYKIRLANFVAWPGDIQEIYSTREGRVIQGNISYKTAGVFVELNVPTRSDTLIIRKVSGPSPATYTTTINGFFPTGKRAYTIVSRGKQLSGTSTTLQSYGTITTTNY